MRLRLNLYFNLAPTSIGTFKAQSATMAIGSKTPIQTDTIVLDTIANARWYRSDARLPGPVLHGLSPPIDVPHSPGRSKKLDPSE